LDAPDEGTARDSVEPLQSQEKQFHFLPMLFTAELLLVAPEGARLNDYSVATGKAAD
jgi:hypothetical protein